MYRNGIPAPKIAAVVGAAETTVRYHLAIAARKDPGLRAEHRSALSKPQRVTALGQRNPDDVLALYATEGRRPARGRTDRERALATWLARCRNEATDGTLSPIYADVLKAFPGWREKPTKREVDAAPWRRDWPRLPHG
jgi:hypothetical protein